MKHYNILNYCRKNLHLSSKYVAKFLNIKEERYLSLENNINKATNKEILALSKLFGISFKDIINNKCYKKTDDMRIKGLMV